MYVCARVCVCPSVRGKSPSVFGEGTLDRGKRDWMWTTECGTVQPERKDGLLRRPGFLVRGSRIKSPDHPLLR